MEKNKEKIVKKFRVLGPVSIIYSLIFVFCLYKNLYGITSPLWAMATVGYIIFLGRQFEKQWRFINTFISVAIVLLGFSNFITGNALIIFFNYVGIILLIIVNMVYLFVDIRGASIIRHFEMLLMLIGGMIGRLCEPFEDVVVFAKEYKPKKNKNIIYILIGLVIALPLTIILIFILASADVVFNNMIVNLIDLLRVDKLIGNVIGLTAMLIAGYMIPYAFSKNICVSNVNVKEEKVLNAKPIIPIIVTAIISFVYGIFSVVQIVYLFMGKGDLPENYSYAEYAREGFFQLLFVSIFNIVIILVCIELFEESKILKAILSIISVCTFIMIASSAYRMSMYIGEYGLTITRVLVLWALAVITLIMLGFLCRIFLQKINMFKLSIVVVTVCFTILSLSRVDYYIAKYNLNMYEGMKTIGYLDVCSYDYLMGLSTDAAPAIMEKKEEIYEYMDMTEQDLDDVSWSYKYYDEYNKNFNFVTIRKFNLSKHISRLSIGE